MAELDTAFAAQVQRLTEHGHTLVNAVRTVVEGSIALGAPARPVREAERRFWRQSGRALGNPYHEWIDASVREAFAAFTAHTPDNVPDALAEEHARRFGPDYDEFPPGTHVWITTSDRGGTAVRPPNAHVARLLANRDSVLVEVFGGKRIPVLRENLKRAERPE